MKTKRLTNKVSNTMVHSVAVGVLISLVVGVLLAIIVTTLIANERLDERRMNIFALAITFLAVAAGGTVTGKKAGRKYALVTALTGAIFLLALICIGIMFFNGGFSGIWTSIAAVVAGIAVSCIFCITKREGKKVRKIRAR